MGCYPETATSIEPTPVPTQVWVSLRNVSVIPDSMPVQLGKVPKTFSVSFPMGPAARTQQGCLCTIRSHA